MLLIKKVVWNQPVRMPVAPVHLSAPIPQLFQGRGTRGEASRWDLQQRSLPADVRSTCYVNNSRENLFVLRQNFPHPHPPLPTSCSASSCSAQTASRGRGWGGRREQNRVLYWQSRVVSAASWQLPKCVLSADGAAGKSNWGFHGKCRKPRRDPKSSVAGAKVHGSQKGRPRRTLRR